jgi:AcrR family transcriptional regulator
LAIKPGPATASRLPLSRARLLATAVALADKDGIESLSMRRLGRELGVEAMSLYNHVANKSDLLGGMVDVVAAEFELPPSGTDWKAAIRTTAISAHQILLRHRWACSLMLSSAGARPARLRYMDSLLATLRRGGFSPEMTHHAYHALESHIMGFTLRQVSFPPAEELTRLASTLPQQLPADEYPYLIEHAGQHAAPLDQDDDDEFGFGLDLILDGLDRLRDAS